MIFGMGMVNCRVPVCPCACGRYVICTSGWFWLVRTILAGGKWYGER